MEDRRIKSMKVEDIQSKDGRMFITYSYPISYSPLDKVNVNLIKPKNVPWDEFKESLFKIIDELEETYDEENGEYLEMFIFGSRMPEICPCCNAKMDEEICPQCGFTVSVVDDEE